MTIFQHIRNKDFIAIILLILLWLIFFWRLFTSIAADQASLKNGDFSGQFVAFGAYQYQRMSQGEIPLWNPYNNGGLPFIADTQAAVFYPPRWLTIGLSSLSGGWTYNALQLEMTFHVLLFSLLMYAFVRRLTLGNDLSVFAAFIASIVASYGGYTSGYPPLQLAILEAAIWFPLSALGILEATRTDNLKGRWILLTGFGLGVSWLAGHPQTSWFMTYLLVAYLAYRMYQQKMGWRTFFGALTLFGIITLGTTAVTFLPGIEYLLQTAREGLGFDEKGNGFPFRDVAQFVFPGIISLWSPLYVGLPALFFICIGIARNMPETRFWLIVALVGLVHSFGANSSFYYATYNLIPGLRFFRGQERAAFLLMISLSILTGIGITAIADWGQASAKSRALRYWRIFTGIIVLIAIGIFIGSLYDYERFKLANESIVFSALIAVAGLFIFPRFMENPKIGSMMTLFAGLIIFELFTVNMDAAGTYDSHPAIQQLSMIPPPLVEQVLQAENDQPFRVDGYRGLRDNFGSLYGVMDMRGISPLFLQGPQSLIYRNYVNNPLAWELLSVQYVYNEAKILSIPSQVIAEGDDIDGHVYLHQLDNPRPFALLTYDVAVVDSDDFAHALMDDPLFDERNSVILHRQATLTLPENPPESSSATVIDFEPEHILIEITTPENAILSLSHPDYVGWQSSLDGQSVDLIRAYAGLTALEIPAGSHTLELNFRPLSYTIGLILSLITWIGLAIIGSWTLIRRR